MFPGTSRKQPILVTGAPRSGTTWLARLLANASGTALLGREPMNPRDRQYGLGGRLKAWVMLQDLDARSRRRLVAAYRGWNPWVYSRYGRRQWAGPLPRTRVIMKDPFALLSLPAVVTATGARPVLVYRHPGAVLASYRRMGWRPDLAELQPIIARCRASGMRVDEVPGPDEVGECEGMAYFWRGLHQVALAGASQSPGLTVVAHQDVASGSESIGRELFRRLGLDWSPGAGQELTQDSEGGVGESSLHNFDRSPAKVAQDWKKRLDQLEVDAVERIAGDTLARLNAMRLYPN